MGTPAYCKEQLDGINAGSIASIEVRLYDFVVGCPLDQRRVV
jgi:hypothetical protein